MSTKLTIADGADLEIGEIMMVKVADIEVDHQVQRTRLQPRKVEKMKREFNSKALGTITLSDRGHGYYIALDGMHRTQVVRELTDGLGEIRARVLTGLTREEEAEIFLLLNDGSQPDKFEKYRVAVVAKHPEVSAIDALVHSFGYTIGNTSAQGTINAIGAVQRLYRLGDQRFDGPGEILKQTLMTIQAAWGDNATGLSAVSLEGVARVIDRFKDIDLGRLADAMKTAVGGPEAVIGAGKQLANIRGLRGWQGVGQKLVDLYNKNLSINSPKHLGAFAV
jgi:uncharacterized protein DUF6551